ncbi:hypothetical protein ACFL1A_00520 [Patescibacteria group bacterium]
MESKQSKALQKKPKMSFPDRRWFFLIPIILVFYFFLYKLTVSRVGAFGCFDDCFNYIGGYFILQGKVIYKDFFFNHQPFAAFISAITQLVANPVNLYGFILAHRLVLLSFGLIFNLILIIRFKMAGLFFVFIYELFKPYMFGERFLAEGFIVYPLVYLIGLVWETHFGRKIYKIDVITGAISAWFVIFMREPFIPLSILLFTFLVYNLRKKRLAIFAFLFLFALSVVVFLLFPFTDYYFNLIEVNKITNAGSELASIFTFSGLGAILSYPWFWFWGGDISYFRIVDSSIAFLIVIYLYSYFLYKKEIKLPLILLAVFFLSNLRPVMPGIVYYEAFHSLVRFGISIFILGLFLKYFYENLSLRKYSFIGVIFAVSIFISFFLTKDSYYHQIINSQKEFSDNYSGIYAYGEAVKRLSRPEHTFFIDGSEELMYWMSGRKSNYKYGWYTSFMPKIEKYSQERKNMLKTDAPDFYWGSCEPAVLPFEKLITDSGKYTRLYIQDKPSCLYVKKDIVRNISDRAWDDVKSLGFSQPEKRL